MVIEIRRKALAYVFPINQRKPTSPTIETSDVGWRLALAFMTITELILLILGRFILLYILIVKKKSLKFFISSIYRFDCNPEADILIRQP